MRYGNEPPQFHHFHQHGYNTSGSVDYATGTVSNTINVNGGSSSSNANAMMSQSHNTNNNINSSVNLSYNKNVHSRGNIGPVSNNSNNNNINNNSATITTTENNGNVMINNINNNNNSYNNNNNLNIPADKGFVNNYNSYNYADNDVMVNYGMNAMPPNETANLYNGVEYYDDPRYAYNSVQFEDGGSRNWNVANQQSSAPLPFVPNSMSYSMNQSHTAVPNQSDIGNKANSNTNNAITNYKEETNNSSNSVHSGNYAGSINQSAPLSPMNLVL